MIFGSQAHAAMRVRQEQKAHSVPAVVVVTSGLVVANVVSAQTWGGFYVDGALGARRTTTDIARSLSASGTFLNPPNVFSFSTINTRTYGQRKTNFLGQLSGGWRWDNGKIVVDIGAFFDLASDDAGEGKEGRRYSEVNSGPGFSESFSASRLFPNPDMLAMPILGARHPRWSRFRTPCPHLLTTTGSPIFMRSNRSLA